MKIGKSIRTRPIETTDYAAVSRIYREAVREYLTSLGKARRDRELGPGRRSAWSTLPRGAFGFYARSGSSFVATSRNKIVGFILTQPISWMNMDSKVLWLEYIAVSPAFRHLGVGSALMASAKKWAAKRGIGCRFTTLNPDNRASRALLQKGGFEVRRWLTARYPSS
ncbi:MAG: GNAT family N-acetyltransferase [Nitrososphaerota archaeon]|nr:GNAT family N-acetyltransferase [Nitrososphaerota archaeon]